MTTPPDNDPHRRWSNVAPLRDDRSQAVLGDLRVERDIVFGKGGDKELLLDVYHPPEGVTPKRTASEANAGVLKTKNRKPAKTPMAARRVPLLVMSATPVSYERIGRRHSP